jgi:1L-myo-inositol 1-phosphate cytidylyltransferase
MERAIVLAAGRGERLVKGKHYPKPLQEVRGVPLIVRILRGLERAGVDEAAVVVGHLGELLVDTLSEYRFELDLRFVWNDEIDKPNGTSLLKARDFVQGPTFLLMSDHLWSPDLIERVRRFPLGAAEAVLGIDHKIAECIDLDDATKVQVAGDRVARIGKNLERYDALDTGVFRITEALIEALARQNGPEGCSLSQGVSELAERGAMRVVDVGDAAWLDVDTPRAMAHAAGLLRSHGSWLRTRRASEKTAVVAAE